MRRSFTVGFRCVVCCLLLGWFGFGSYAEVSNCYLVKVYMMGQPLPAGGCRIYLDESYGGTGGTSHTTYMGKLENPPNLLGPRTNWFYAPSYLFDASITNFPCVNIHVRAHRYTNGAYLRSLVLDSIDGGQYSAWSDWYSYNDASSAEYWVGVKEWIYSWTDVDPWTWVQGEILMWTQAVTIAQTVMVSWADFDDSRGSNQVLAPISVTSVYVYVTQGGYTSVVSGSFTNFDGSMTSLQGRAQLTNAAWAGGLSNIVSCVTSVWDFIGTMGTGTYKLYIPWYWSGGHLTGGASTSASVYCIDFSGHSTESGYVRTLLTFLLYVVGGFGVLAIMKWALS